jgi:fibronectin-binding autotransporter adhesin
VTLSAAFLTGPLGTATLLKTGSGTLALGHANTYTGGTTVNVGGLSFVQGALGGSGQIMLNGATLLWAAGNTQDISTDGTISRLSLADGKTSTLDVGANNVTLSAAFLTGLSGTAALVKAGTGTLALGHANTYSGGTTINAGTLNFANGALGASGTITLGGATLQWAAGNTQDISINGSNVRLLLADGKTATLDTGANNVMLSAGLLSGAAKTASLVKAGTGVLTISGELSYTGSTTVSGGKLQIFSPLATQGTIALSTVTGAGELDVGNGSIPSIVTAGSISVGTLSVGAGSTVKINALPSGPVSGGATPGVAGVPEPSTLLLLGLGAMGLIAGIWRNRI